MLHGKQTNCKSFILKKVFHHAIKKALAWSRWLWVEIIAALELGCFTNWHVPSLLLHGYYILSFLGHEDLMCKTNIINMNYLPPCPTSIYLND